MTKIATSVTALICVLAASATATARMPQDYTSPDARPAAVTQDLRSPDATRPVPSTDFVQQDLRSPDARPTATRRVVDSMPVAAPHSSDSFQWGYLALGIAIVSLISLGVIVTGRRRRHGLAIGS